MNAEAGLALRGIARRPPSERERTSLRCLLRDWADRGESAIEARCYLAIDARASDTASWSPLFAGECAVSAPRCGGRLRLTTATVEELGTVFKHSHLEKKLREHGRAARAEILSIKTEGNSGTQNPFKAYSASDDDLTTSWWLCKLELRVMPPGEPAFEKTVHTRLNTIKGKGDTVPVLYDPDDHDDVVVDYNADAQAEMDRLNTLREAAKRLPADVRTEARAAPLGTELQRLLELEEAERHAAAAPAGQPAGGSQARLDQLQQLAALHAQGILTDAEVAQEKARILSAS